MEMTEWRWCFNMVPDMPADGEWWFTASSQSSSNGSCGSVRFGGVVSLSLSREPNESRSRLPYAASL